MQYIFGSDLIINILSEVIAFRPLVFLTGKDLLSAVNATIQMYFMDLAERYSPATKDFASSLTPVAVNVGIALGSSLGGIVIASGSLEQLSWVGGIAALVASGLAFISYRLDKNDNVVEIKNHISECS